MDKLIIIPSKDFFKEYWQNFGNFELSDELKAIQLSAEIMMELRRNNTTMRRVNCRVVIPNELRQELSKHFSAVTFSEHFHDSITEVDMTTTKFEKPCESSDHAVVETAKIFSETHSILIIGNRPIFKELTKDEENIGVSSIIDFAKGFKDILDSKQ